MTNLIQSRQKLIKLADKNKAGWLVVEEYEQEELAEDSDDEKRIRRAESQALKKRMKQSANNQGGKRPRIERILPLPLLIKVKSANMKLTKTGRFF